MAGWRWGLAALVLAGCGTITRPIHGLADDGVSAAAARANPFTGLGVQVQPTRARCTCVALAGTLDKHKLTLAAEDDKLQQLVLDGRMLVNDGKVVNPANPDNPWILPRPLAQPPAQRAAGVARVVAELAEVLRDQDNGTIQQAVAALTRFKP
jgi:hypothetical protein